MAVLVLASGRKETVPLILYEASVMPKTGYSVIIFSAENKCSYIDHVSS